MHRGSGRQIDEAAVGLPQKMAQMSVGTEGGNGNGNGNGKCVEPNDYREQIPR